VDRRAAPAKFSRLPRVIVDSSNISVIVSALSVATP
jgi:hypothetical protein